MTQYKLVLLIDTQMDKNALLEDLSTLHDFYEDMKIIHIEEVKSKKVIEKEESTYDKILLRNVESKERAEFIITKNPSWTQATIEDDDCNPGNFKIVLKTQLGLFLNNN